MRSKPLIGASVAAALLLAATVVFAQGSLTFSASPNIAIPEGGGTMAGRTGRCVARPGLASIGRRPRVPLRSNRGCFCAASSTLRNADRG